MKKIYSEEHIQFLRDNIKGRRCKEVVKLFNEHFGFSVTDTAVRTLLTRHKIYNNRGRGIPNGRKIYFEEHINYLKKIVPERSYSEITKLFNDKYGFELNENAMSSMLKRLNLTNGRDTRIKPGNVPFNKGKKGCCPPGCEKTWFPKGHVSANWRPIGSERINSDGYIEIKVSNDVMPKQRRWRAKHVVFWEKENGPVPKSHVVIFADGNRLNCELSNLILVSRKELAVLNHMRLLSLDKEITKTAVNIARVKVLTADRKRENG